MGSVIPLRQPPVRAPFRGGSPLRAAIWACAIAFVIHLVPLFFPRKVPSVELELARLVPQAEHRESLLLPLLRNPKSSPAELREAAVLILPASVPDARLFLVEAERRGPASVENELLRARICHVDSDETCVSGAFAKARALAPGDPRADLLESELAEAAGDPKAALAALTRAHDKAPADVELTLRLARALGESSRVEDGERLVSALTPQIGPARAAVERGVLLLNAHRHTDARAELENALRLDRSNPLAHYFHAVVLARQGDEPKAEQELREADRLDPSDHRPLAMLCALQREDGRVDDAAISRALLDARFRDRRSEYDGACPP